MLNNNMNFGVDLLPTTDNTFNLGSSQLKWNIYANSIQIGDNNYTPITSQGSEGDLLYWTARNTPDRLEIEADGNFLTINSGKPAWSSLPTASTSGAGIVQLSNSTDGTSETTAATEKAVKTAYDSAIPKSIGTAAGDIIYWSSSGIPVRLGIGDNGAFLKLSSNIPSWAKLVANDIPSLNASKINDGTFDSARIPSLDASKISTGTFDSARIPGLDASKISTGTLSVSRGGTGAESFTVDSVIISGSTATSALTTRAIKDNSTPAAFFGANVSNINQATDRDYIPTLRTIYYGLPSINGTHSYDSDTAIFAPTSSGTSDYILKANNNAAPTWISHLSVSQGGTGATTFTSGNVLVGNGTSAITTIAKTNAATENTLVLRDNQGNFAANKITLSTGIDTVVAVDNNNNITTASIINIANKIATISSSTINMNYEHYNGDSTVQPAINWYYIKSSLDANNITIQTNEKIGAMFWSTNNQQAVFQNIFKNSNNATLTESYKLPAPTTNATSDGIYDIITTKGMSAGALYAKIPDGGQDLALNWGILPIELGGTGVDSIGALFNEIKGNGDDDNLGDTWWVKKNGDKMSGKLCITATDNGANIALSNNNKNAYQLALGSLNSDHLGLDAYQIQAFGYSNNQLTFKQLNLNPFGGNVSIITNLLIGKQNNNDRTIQYLFPDASNPVVQNIITITPDSEHKSIVAKFHGQFATSRRFTIGNRYQDFDGSDNVSWTVPQIGAIKRDSDDTMTGNLTIQKTGARVSFNDGTRDWGYVGNASDTSTHGVYSNGWLDSTETWHSDGKWLIYRANDGNSFVNIYGLRNRTNLTKGINPSGTTGTISCWTYQSGSGIETTDRLNGFYGSVQNDGTSTFGIVAYNYNTNKDDANWLGVKINGTTRSYSVSDPTAFRNAIGASSGIWPVTAGGTGNNVGRATYVITTVNTTAGDNLQLLGVTSSDDTNVQRRTNAYLTYGTTKTGIMLVNPSNSNQYLELRGDQEGGNVKFSKSSTEMCEMDMYGDIFRIYSYRDLANTQGFGMFSWNRVTGQIVSKMTQDVDYATAPNEETNHPLLSFFDGSNTQRFNIYSNRTTDGTYKTYIMTGNSTTGYNQISIGIKSNGDRTYTVSDSTAFRNAIGASSTGVWPASVGGTGQTTLRDAANSLLSSLSTATANMSSAGYIITSNATDPSDNLFYRRTADKIVNATLVKAALGTDSTTETFLRKDGTWSNTLTGQLILSKETDIGGGGASECALIVGNKTGTHLAIDGNEIMAKTGATTVGSLSLNYDGGNVIIGTDDANYKVNIRSTMASSSKTTGALVVGGGAGFGGTVYANAFNGPLTGNVTGNCSGTAGAVAWANVTGRPSNAGSASRPVYWSGNAAVQSDISATAFDSTTQLWGIRYYGTVSGSSYTGSNNDSTSQALIFTDNGLFLYKWRTSSNTTIWGWQKNSDGYWEGSISGSSGSCRGNAATATSANSQSYQYTDVDFSKTNNNISEAKERNFAWIGDKNGSGMGRLYFSATTSGTTIVRLQARAWNTSSSEVGSFLGISITGNRDNTVSYTVSNQANFRTAIGASSGTWPVSIGGTGATSFTANCAIISGSTTTSALTTRAITNNTSATAVTASTNLITANTLYYHKGNTNLTNCSQGAFGSIVTLNKGSGTTTFLRNDGTWTATLTANIIVSKDGSGYLQSVDSSGLKVSLGIGSGRQAHGVYSTGYCASAGTHTASAGWIIYRNSAGNVNTDFKLYGAVWNDYAEFRHTNEEIEPGRCIIETGSGDLVLSTKRLQQGAEIVSDTFGMAIGYSKNCKTPTAATGRVLAYLYEDRAFAKPGAPVCSGPNGTVSIMTDEEARMRPWCIIGTISEIPNYEEWECGNINSDLEPEDINTRKSEKIKVNGRVWIRMR